MAPRLCGAGFESTCPQCGFSARFGVEHPPVQGLFSCPRCESVREIDSLAELDVRRGDRVLIDKASYLVREPKRWEVVAIRMPADSPVAPGELAVKRIIGLPGETITLCEGDVHADGHRICKSFDQMRDVAVELPNATLKAAGAERWFAEPADSGWRLAGGAAHYEPGKRCGGIEWLVFRDANRPTPRVEPPIDSPTLDSYVYNQSLSRRLHAVADKWLTFQGILQGKGRLFFRLGPPESCVETIINPTANTLVLKIQGYELSPSPLALDPAATDRPVRIDVGYWDRRIWVLIDGWTAILYDLGDQQKPSIAAGEGDVAIGAEGLTIKEARWRLYRDVYYYWPNEEAAASERSVMLGADEYFVLGDNVPVSYDSRYEPLNRLPGEAIVGRVIDREKRER